MGMLAHCACLSDEGCGKQEISVRVEISALVKVRFSSGSSCSLVRH